MIGSNHFKIAMRSRVSSVVSERGRDGRGRKSTTRLIGRIAVDTE